MQGVQIKLTEKSQETKMIYIYDIESETSLKTQPFILLNSFDGLGQLNFNNFLFFCGGSEKKKGGTYFLQYDPIKSINSLTMMINCLFDHKYPSMIGYKNEFIIVVGGMEGNTRCEIYGVNKKKWKALPELPEPRFGSSLLSEEKQEFIYLFGGISTDNYCVSVLRLNMKSLIVWESVIVKENSYLLQKSHLAIVKYDRSLILLLGGSKKDEEFTDQILEFDLVSKTVKQSNLRLSRPAKFFMSNYADLNNQTFFFFDTSSYVHTFNKIDLKFKANHYVDTIQDEDTHAF